jgi:hypothetical protein
MKPTYCGIDVIVSPLLPIPPSDGERARRIVRHGMADVLAWLDEEVGPGVDEQTHVILGSDLGGDGALAFVSAEMFERLRNQEVAA